jgi:hypothetical protein
MNCEQFADGDVFQATICDQVISNSLAGELQIVLTVGIAAKLDDPRDPLGPTRAVAPYERDVYLTMSDEPQRRSMVEADLTRLGIDPADVLRLHPDHPQSISLIGKGVHVQCRFRGTSVYWNLARFRPERRAVTLKEAELLLQRPQASSIHTADAPPPDSTDCPATAEKE